MDNWLMYILAFPLAISIALGGFCIALWLHTKIEDKRYYTALNKWYKTQKMKRR